MKRSFSNFIPFEPSDPPSRRVAELGLLIKKLREDLKTIDKTVSQLDQRDTDNKPEAPVASYKRT